MKLLTTGLLHLLLSYILLIRNIVHNNTILTAKIRTNEREISSLLEYFSQRVQVSSAMQSLNV